MRYCKFSKKGDVILDIFSMKKEENEHHSSKKTNTEESAGITLSGKDGVTLSCLTVIGQVEGHYLLSENQKTTKYEHVLPLLAAVEENPEVDGLLVLINTVGGDVEAGLAIAEMLASMQTPTASVVIGGGHSIGIPIAVSCSRSFIVPSATMTIHPVRTSGTILGVPQAFEGLEKMQNRIVRFVTDHSHITEDALRRLIFRTDEMATDVGSIVDGEEAVRLGLIDEIGGLAGAMTWLREEKMRREEKSFK